MNHEICISANDIPEQIEGRRPEWDKVIEKHAESGTSAVRYCREHEINYENPDAKTQTYENPDGLKLDNLMQNTTAIISRLFPVVAEHP